MTGNNRKNASDETLGYECIDPALGTNMWRLDVDDTAEELRARLDTHLHYCADCRIQRRVIAAVSTGLSEGSLHLSKPGRGPLISRTLSATGIVALAASLLLMFAMPPVATHQKMAVRGGNAGQEITRPVPDEILRDRSPVITWQPLADATSYKVRIEGVGNDYKWSQTTSGSEISVPADNNLPVSERFRVFVEPVPAYLAPAGGWRSSFSTASLLPFVKYRIGAAPAESRSLAIFALGMIILGALTPMFWKRRLKI
jgi:hypothetical protein